MPVRLAEDMVDRREDDALPGVLEAIPLLPTKALGKLAMDEIGIEEDDDDDNNNKGVLVMVGAGTGVDEDDVVWLA